MYTRHAGPSSIRVCPESGPSSRCSRSSPRSRRAPSPARSRPAPTCPTAPPWCASRPPPCREIKTAKFLITADGAISGLSLRRAEGTLTKEGDAKGTAQIEQGGAEPRPDLRDRRRQDLPEGRRPADTRRCRSTLAATVYDPSAILDPDRGIAKVLSTAKDAEDRGRRGGRRQGRLAGGDRPRTAPTWSTIIPGVSGGTPGKVWLDSADKRLHKAVFTLPAGRRRRPARSP